MMLNSLLWLACVAVQASARALGGLSSLEVLPYAGAALQDVVTWDNSTIFIHGKRVLIYSGEYHPYRLPVPSLWMDVFQKIKAMGFNACSVYFDWALHEGEPGKYLSEGVFDLALFLQVAKEAGVWIIARPGPYINAEVSGGGFPGWMQRNQGILRTKAPAYMQATYNYMNSTGKIIAAAQVTKGGAVIMVQPENEYFSFAPGFSRDAQYHQLVEDQLRNAGITVPLIGNHGGGKYLPGSGTGQLDLYGFDAYPLGFNCKDPYRWTSDSVPTDYWSKCLASPTTPCAMPEYQAGSFDPWGGAGFDNCAILTNHEFVRLYYKNQFASGLKILSLYMTYGGTNWGNVGYPVGYTSYDYGAAIMENREIIREKYAVGKLIATMWQSSPAYFTAAPGAVSTTAYTNTTSISVTPVSNTNGRIKTGFYVARHTGGEVVTSYLLTLDTTAGKLTIPQLGGSLTLSPKDSKIHVTDYAVGSYNMLYSSAEVFTQQSYSTYSIIILYGGVGELHEAAFSGAPTTSIISGRGVAIKERNGATVLNWQTSTSRRIIKVGKDLFVYILDTNSAYNYWVTFLPGNDKFGAFSTDSPVVLHAGYLIRNATVTGKSLHVRGDINATSPLEVIGAPVPVESLYFNGNLVSSTSAAAPLLSGSVAYANPSISLPALSGLSWKSIDSLPELSSTYDDSKWTVAKLTKTPNTLRSLTTPTSLYGTDYGYGIGVLVFRGHFKANGSETAISMTHQGGEGYAASVWLNSKYLGSWSGSGKGTSANVTYAITKLAADSSNVINVVVDQNGIAQNYKVGGEEAKLPRGILNYNIAGRDPQVVSWKLSGNLGGEAYVDKTRGPLNEGGLFAMRKGYHLPNPPTGSWTAVSPLTGTTAPGVTLYSAQLNLALPKGYDIPIYFNFPALKSGNYRCELFINGWQFGKYVNNIGPQTSFPVPEGILNYQGANTIAVSLWSQDAKGNKLASFTMTSGTPILSGYGSVSLVDSPAYSARVGSY